MRKLCQGDAVVRPATGEIIDPAEVRERGTHISKHARARANADVHCVQVMGPIRYGRKAVIMGDTCGAPKLEPLARDCDVSEMSVPCALLDTESLCAHDSHSAPCTVLVARMHGG